MAASESDVDHAGGSGNFVALRKDYKDIRTHEDVEEHNQATVAELLGGGLVKLSATERALHKWRLVHGHYIKNEV